MQPTAPFLIRGYWLFPGGQTPEQIIRDGAVVVDSETIVEVGPWVELRQRYPAAAVLGSEGHAVLPGLINAHHHASGVTHIQQGVTDQLLEPWLLEMASCRETDPFLATQLTGARLLRSGVTSVVEVYSNDGPPEALAANLERSLNGYAQAGLRVAFAIGLKQQCHLFGGDDEAFLQTLPAGVQALTRRSLPGPGAAMPADYFAIMDGLWRRYAGHPRLELWFAPPGLQSVSDEFFMRIVETAERYDTGVQTHLEESVYEKLYGLRAYGAPTVQHLAQLGVLSPRLSFAHGVWLTEAEIELLAESGAAVSHNPSSNLRLRAGIAPLNTLLAAGVTVGLGMDGMTINDNEDMWQEMRLALRLHRTPRLNSPAPTPAQIFQLATHGGATLLRAADWRGSLASGYLADIVLLKLDRIMWPWTAPEVDPLTLILYRAAAGDVDTVLVGGQVVVEAGRVTTLDEAAVGQELAARLRQTDYPADQAALVEALKPYIEQYYQSWPMEEFQPYTIYNSRS
jgi:cytosine/adenosine deaminase-related metal-dependent hydrolase